MRTLPSGSQTASSDTPRRRNRNQKKMKRLQQKMRRLAMMTTNKSTLLPTLQQMTVLLEKGKDIVLAVKKTPSLANIFLACILLLSAAPTHGDSYWAYVPKPPMVHPVTWTKPKHIKVMTTVTKILGETPVLTTKKKYSSVFSYEGKSDSAPICLGLSGISVPGCLPVSYRTFVTDTLDPNDQARRLVWELQIKTLGWYTVNKTFSWYEELPLPDCTKIYYNPDIPWVYNEQYPNWLSCGFKVRGMPFKITDTKKIIWDFSASSPFRDSSIYFKKYAYRYNNYKPNSVIYRYFSPGFVEPIWVSKHQNKTRIQPKLFRLAAAIDMVLLKNLRLLLLKLFL
ncbi:uncharacterized protein LOC132655215 [Meriones unguiculatus]|uniref:uncharacterized protein LOC132655215 n=1 Tax=Meriones unguiculatus TaxID=10047 RepID=UPI00293E606F|nr:uncharacterized protein LOC132655215 [Meriones unguiculatus]